MEKKPRLIVAVLTSLIDEAIIIAVILWLLPRLGVHLQVYWLVIICLGFAAFAVTTYILGTHALARKPVKGLSSMIGMTGDVVEPLSPRGCIKIKGELWNAKAESGVIEGGEVIVTGQDRMMLIVRKYTQDNG